MKRKLMAARRNNNLTLWDNLRISNKTYYKLHTRTKRNKWRNICADTESARESARMSKILKNGNDKKAKLYSIYKPDGTLTETADETLEIMEKSHFKDGDSPAHTNTNTSPEKNKKQKQTNKKTSPDKHLSQIIYIDSLNTRYPIVSRALGLAAAREQRNLLYARYLCSRDAPGLKAGR